MAEVFVRKPEFFRTEQQRYRRIGKPPANQLRSVFETPDGVLQLAMANRGCAYHQGAIGDSFRHGGELLRRLEQRRRAYGGACFAERHVVGVDDAQPRKAEVRHSARRSPDVERVARGDEDDADAVVPGLMAIGEAACVSVHGANRLGTNSLLDLIVFGRAAALRAAELVKPGSRVREANVHSVEHALQRFDKIRNSKGGNKPGEIRPLMQEAMQSGFAVFRRGDTLKQGLDKLMALRDPLERVTVDNASLLWNVALVSALELANLAEQAVVIAHSACERTESRGAHAREDYHQRDDKNWLKHTVAWMDADWSVTFAYRPVHLNALSNDVQSFPPAERTH